MRYKILIISLILLCMKLAGGATSSGIKSSGEKDASKKEYVHLIMYGQSLSVGHQSYPVISTENVPGNFMIGNQIWINYGNNNVAELTPLRGTIAVAFQSQKNIRSRSAGTIAECPLFGAANHIQLKVPGSPIIATSCGTSGKTIEQLSPESQTTHLYDDFRTTISRASEIARNSGAGISCPAIFWMQGEWNYQGYQDGLTPGSKPTADKNEYKSLLIRLKNNMQAAVVKQYGQKEKPLFITYQVGAQYIKGREQAIGMAQLEASNENTDIVMAGPIYPMTDRGGHLDSNGYRWFGEMLGKVYFYAKVKGQDFRPLQPVQISRTDSDKELKIRFHVPQPPLVFDNLTTKRVADYGFEVHVNNKKDSITSVAVSGDSVILNLKNSLKGTVEVAYAGQSTAGHGNLRDSDPYQAFYKYTDLDAKNADGSFVYPRDSTETTLRPSYEPRDASGNIIYGQPYPLYNFCISFYYKLNPEAQSFEIKGMNLADARN